MSYIGLEHFQGYKSLTLIIFVISSQVLIVGCLTSLGVGLAQSTVSLTSTCLLIFTVGYLMAQLKQKSLLSSEFCFRLRA